MLREKVLIVDDNKVNRAIVNKIIGGSYETLEAENGKEALDMLYSDDGISAVMLDIKMPVMDGYEFLRQIRAVPAYVDLPVFAVTDGYDESDEIKALEAGVNEYFEKILRPAVILKHLENYMREQKARRAADNDSLTGIMNRSTVRKYIDAFVECADHGKKAALMIFGINNMPREDSSSDDYLVLFSQIMQKEFDENASLGRLGVDEFVVLLKNADDSLKVKKAVNRVINDFAKECGDGEEAMSVNAGVCEFTTGSATVGELFRSCDDAIKASHKVGKNSLIYSEFSVSPMNAGSQDVTGSQLLDELEDYVFLCDAKTSKVIFKNAETAKLLSSIPDGEPQCICHKLGLDGEPFLFCLKQGLSSDHWSTQRFTAPDGTDMLYKCKLVNREGRLAKLVEIVRDIK